MRLGDLTERCAGCDQWLELFSGEPAARRVLAAAVGFEAMLLEPIGDRRGVSAHERGDLLQR
jgi:hypothetical protein